MGDLIFLARAETIDEVMADWEVMRHGLEARTMERIHPITHIDEEPMENALSNCKYPNEHSLKYSKKGAKGNYCWECWRKLKEAKGEWKSKSITP